MGKPLKIIMKVVAALVALCLIATVVCVTLQIITRYFLRDPIPWTEQMTRLFFVWAVFLGIPLAFYEGEGFKFDLFVKKLGPKVGFITDILAWVVSLGFCGYMLYWTIMLTMQAGSKVTVGVEVQFYYLYGAEALCMFLLILFSSTHSLLFTIKSVKLK